MTVTAVCRCGRVYTEAQSADLWACLRRHVEDDRLLDEWQAKAGTWTTP